MLDLKNKDRHISACENHKKFNPRCQKCKAKKKKLKEIDGLSPSMFKRYLDEEEKQLNEAVRLANKKLDILETQFSIQKEVLITLMDHHYSIIYIIKNYSSK